MWKVAIRPYIGDKNSVKLVASEVNLMSPPFVYIRGIKPEVKSSIIQIPKSAVEAEYGQFKTLIIPYNALEYAGEYDEKSIKTERCYVGLDSEGNAIEGTRKVITLLNPPPPSSTNDPGYTDDDNNNPA